MSVSLDRASAAVDEPSTPRIWLWGGLLLALMALGVALALWLGPDTLMQNSQRFWLLALGVPALAWLGALFLRGLLYAGQMSVVEGWNEAREADLAQRMRQGRRSQQVLAVSLQTALRAPDAEGHEQQASLLAKDGHALRTQVDWGGHMRRHSRLPYLEHETEQQLLRRVLATLLGELTSALAAFPSDRPVELLLEIDSGMPDEITSRLWQESLAASGIRQALTRIDGSGLSVIEHWLDQRTHDQALLLVVAIQVAPPLVEGSAESAVGLLFGNRLTQDVLLPTAYLHRPERAHELTSEGALQAVLQALDWVPVPVGRIGRVWITRSDSVCGSVITSAMAKASLPAQFSHDLHDVLGNPGSASPWVAIAAAVEAAASEAVPQFLFSAAREEDASLWCAVVMPTEAPGE